MIVNPVVQLKNKHRILNGYEPTYKKYNDDNNAKIALTEQGRKCRSDAVHKSCDKAAQEQQGIKVSVLHIDSLNIPATQTHIKNALSEWTLEMLASENLIYMDTEAHQEPTECVVTYFASQDNIDKNCLKDWFKVDGVDGSGIKYFNSGYKMLFPIFGYKHNEPILLVNKELETIYLNFWQLGERVDGSVECVKDNQLKMAKCPHVPWMSIGGPDRKPWLVTSFF
ncbi:hypothetical protein BC830DRAFT_1214503 [Chytriomyces sp. MP71]|nr:hypothetical protein BC830DRAFT_1214503 [Chytriomyces sp. MP71]